MAEGGVPVEPQAAEPTFQGRPGPESIDLLHVYFTRDLITYVIRRRFPVWTFSPQYARPCPVTPFSYRIRHAVDFYLTKECINFDTLFHLAFMDYPFNVDSFGRVLKFAIRSVFHRTESYTDLLRLLFFLCHFTVRALQRGVHAAPYIAFFNFHMLLATFIKRRGEDAEYFYGMLGYKARDLIHEDTPIYFYNEPND